MKTPVRHLRCLALLSLLALPTALWAQTVWSLAGDWSNSSNPNGVWKLTNNGTAFTNQYNYHDASLGTPVQAWAKAAGAVWNDPTDQLPAWYRAVVAHDGGCDYQVGDIYVHPPYSAGGYTSAIWQSPISGSVSVSGSIWGLLSFLGRTNDWGIYVNGSLVSSGTVSDSSSSRAAPVFLYSGTGGAGALSAIAVGLNDTIELRIWQDLSSPYPSPNGLSLTVTSAVPEPATSALLLGLGTLGVGLWRLRGRSRSIPAAE